MPVLSAMKIIAINGSPNKDGSTSILIDLLIDELNEKGAECEKIDLEDYTIRCCENCNKCLKSKMCCLDDDYIHLKAKMLWADAIIIGSPYYGGKPTMQLKIFLDRLALASFFHREFEKKHFIGVSTSAVENKLKVSKYCANLGMYSYIGGTFVSGLLHETTVSEEGIKELKTDLELKKRIKKLADKLTKEVGRNKQSFIRNTIKIIFPKKLRFYCIGLTRKREKVTYVLRQFLIKKGLIKNSFKIEE